LQGLAAASALPLIPAVVRAQSAPIIHAAMIPNEPAALIYYAGDNGFFDKAGITVEIAQNPSTPAVVSAVASGTYDIAFANISTLALAHSHGLPFVSIAPGVGWVPGRIVGNIVVPVSSTAKTAKDFNGKTFATPGLNTIGEYLPREWMDKHGGDSSTVKFIEIPFPLQADALASGRVDAAYLVEPFLTLALKKGAVRTFALPDDALGPSYLATKVVPILAKYLHADPAITAEANRAYFSERLIPSEVQPWIDVTAKYAKFPTFPAAEIIYTPS
jgi:ABC-type nitrate/sulfonate/bicarbonate transport system substrate-binding protein